MVQPKGWDGVKPYWWCDNEHTRAVSDHLWYNLVHHPENGIRIKGVDKIIFNCIEINSMLSHNIININVIMDNDELRIQTADAVSLVMEDAFINNKNYTLKSTEQNKNTFNLQYIWQPKDKK